MDALHSFASRFGIRLADRAASDSWIYDGDTIALRYEYNAYFTQAEVLHEIGHWLACIDPEQRLFPEFGLSIGLTGAYGTIRDGFRKQNGDLDWNALDYYDSGLFDAHESNIQEYLAELVSKYVGERLNILPYYSDGTSFDSWEDYFKIISVKPDQDALKKAKDRFPGLLNKYLI